MNPPQKHVRARTWTQYMPGHERCQSREAPAGTEGMPAFVSAIFMRRAADALNILVPFGHLRYRDVRPTLLRQHPQPRMKTRTMVHSVG
jgi:hypothetical protein